MMQKEIDIGVLSKQTNLPTSTIRFYEDKGLIHSIRRKGLRRQYPHDVIETLSLITIGKKSGLSLDEIKELFLCHSKISVNRGLLRKKIEELMVNLEHLQTALSTLKHIEQCPHEHHLSCQEFRKLLNIDW
ncbi:MerR family transcriptional regulator [Neisseria sp. Ec49-e6-T10]|uniref:MerR family transcriptional regulator n=1 Tax=Neisseria sp. Ec49-e6-T10 TaxID=3140744 RepID=UPI003EB7952E